MEQELPDGDEDLEESDEVGEFYGRAIAETNQETPLCVRVSKKVRELFRGCEAFTEEDPRKLTLLLVEDDDHVAEDYAFYLAAAGFSVCVTNSAEEALFHAESYRQFTAVVLDIRMNASKLSGRFEQSGGQRTGLALALELSNHVPDSLFFALTNTKDAFVQEWFSDQDGREFYFCRKEEYPPQRFAGFIKRKVYKFMEKPFGLRAFIVHGHDHHALLELKNYLQNTLHFSEPIILQEKPSGANTVIEKFEKHAKDIDVAFVMLTPDDLVDPAQTTTGRARQNVLFELGYFVGALGRKTGRVLLLAKKGVEIPSDLAGIIYIDITNGIAAAGEKIRLELEAL